MLETYGTADFDDILSDIEAEVDCLKNNYSPYRKNHVEKASDYNHLVTVLLILREIET